MRFVRKFVLRGCLALAGLAVFAYAVDDVWTRVQGRPMEQVKVDRLYAAENHFHQIEYSVGTPVMQTCIDALMPHFGYVPCWYLRRHTIQHIVNP